MDKELIMLTSINFAKRENMVPTFQEVHGGLTIIDELSKVGLRNDQCTNVIFNFILTPPIL